MAKRLKRGEAGAAGARRVLRRETAKAVQSLRTNVLRAEAIHDARKRLKKARAALRLVRAALSRDQYRRENRLLRDAARPLSEIRDAEVLIETLASLARRARGRHRRAFAVLRGRLEGERRALQRRFHDDAVARAVRKQMARSRKRAQDFPGHGGWSVLGRGLERVYRAGHEGYAAARKESTTENLHECRKQTKYLWHQLELLESIRPRPMRRLARTAHTLSDHLGDDHDLAVLRDKLEAARPALPRGALRGMERMVGERRGTLQRQAFAIAERLYREPPARFVARIERRWHRWRSARVSRAG